MNRLLILAVVFLLGASCESIGSSEVESNQISNIGEDECILGETSPDCGSGHVEFVCSNNPTEPVGFRDASCDECPLLIRCEEDEDDVL